MAATPPKPPQISSDDRDKDDNKVREKKIISIKADGNRAFRRGDATAALHCYDEALRLARGEPAGVTDEDAGSDGAAAAATLPRGGGGGTSATDPAVVALLRLNRAAALLALHRAAEALDDASAAAEVSPSAKAHLRAATAALEARKQRTADGAACGDAAVDAPQRSDRALLEAAVHHLGRALACDPASRSVSSAAVAPVAELRRLLQAEGSTDDAAINAMRELRFREWLLFCGVYWRELRHSGVAAPPPLSGHCLVARGSGGGDSCALLLGGRGVRDGYIEHTELRVARGTSTADWRALAGVRGCPPSPRAWHCAAKVVPSSSGDAIVVFGA